jgi:hypothetical protein
MGINAGGDSRQVLAGTGENLPSAVKGTVD